MCGHDLAICDALGTTKGEYQILLNEVVVEGKIELANRLLEFGVRLDEVPNTQSLEAISVLRAHGSRIDHERLRKHAATRGYAEVLRYVVDEFGPALSMDECFTITRDLVGFYDPRLMLGFLIKDSGLDVNYVFHDTGSNQVTNLLKIASLEFNWLAITFLDIVRCQAVHLGPLDYSSRHDYETIVDALTRDSARNESSSPVSSSENMAELSLDDDHVSADADFINSEREGPLSEIDSPARATPTRAMSVPDAYKAFEYDALQDLGAIRIVEIQPSQDGEDFIVCRLEHTNLASRP